WMDANGFAAVDFPTLSDVAAADADEASGLGRFGARFSLRGVNLAPQRAECAPLPRSRSN
ncbi:hypothetical protein AAEJ42_22940, partial [Shewanella algae]|uniref:hypothetical protein n=1 Tax=Shewanella algae TaxID=38313 RepID=UPI00313EE0DE